MSEKPPKLHHDILNLLKKYQQADDQYINPHFLVQIAEAISDYYDLEDDEVDKWIQDMFGW